MFGIFGNYLNCFTTSMLDAQHHHDAETATNQPAETHTYRQQVLSLHDHQESLFYFINAAEEQRLEALVTLPQREEDYLRIIDGGSTKCP